MFDEGFIHVISDEECDIEKDVIEEVESYLYSQIHYKNVNDSLNVMPLTQDVNSVLISSDSEDEIAVPDTKTSHFIEGDSDSDYAGSMKSYAGSMQLQFNTQVTPSQSSHPLMSVRQRYRSNAQLRYFDASKKATNRTAELTDINDPNFVFRCFLCGKESHLSSMCPIRSSERSRRQSWRSYSNNNTCSTCGRNDHNAKSWMVRGPPRYVCPNIRCPCCGGHGHKLVDCHEYEFFRGRVCLTCGVPGHVRNWCPDMWRMYHATTERSSDTKGVISTQSNVTINSRRFCYICGRSGHFGFECCWQHRPSTARFLKSPFISTYSKNGGENGDDLHFQPQEEQSVTVPLHQIRSEIVHGRKSRKHDAVMYRFKKRVKRPWLSTTNRFEKTDRNQYHKHSKPTINDSTDRYCKRRRVHQTSPRSRERIRRRHSFS